MDPNVQKSASASDARKQSAPRLPKFDTMQAVENLKRAEFQEQQAVAIVETLRDSQVEFATREDLHAGLERLELVLHDEIGSLRTELRGEIGGLRTEMHDEISRLEIGMQNQLATMYWRLLIGISIVVGIFGTLVTLANGA